MINFQLRPVLLACVFCLSATSALSAHAERARWARGNAQGGVTTGFEAAHAGEAASGVRGHRLVTDGQGDAKFTSGAAFKGKNGGYFKRAGKTTSSADGSMTHESGFKASGAKGSVQSQGSATRDANGDVTQSRTTTGTSASTGDSFKSTTTYDKADGVSHSVTCFDSSGAQMACPAGK